MTTNKTLIPADVLDDEGQRITLIKKAQLPFGRFVRRGVDEDAALEQVRGAKDKAGALSTEVQNLVDGLQTQISSLKLLIGRISKKIAL